MTEKKKADAVLEGGGVKGIGLVGALTIAEEEYEWANLAGTSAGAIVAALLAVGYTALEVKSILDELDFRKFKDEGLLDKIPIIGPALSLGFEKGIYEGDYFEQLMADYLSAKDKTRFGDIRTDFEDERYRYKLQVIASDVSRGRLLVLPQDIKDYGGDPDELEIARAVRMSMSIPFFFEPMRLQNVSTGQESYIVDGGLLSNFPVWLFDSDGEPEWPTFGFRLVEGDVRSGRHQVKHEISGPISLLTAMFFTAMEAHDARYIEDQDIVRTVCIPTLGISSIDFGLSQQDKQRLYLAGRAAATKFFHRWEDKGGFPQYMIDYRQNTTLHGRGALK